MRVVRYDVEAYGVKAEFRSFKTKKNALIHAIEHEAMGHSVIITAYDKNGKTRKLKIGFINV